MKDMDGSEMDLRNHAGESIEYCDAHKRFETEAEWRAAHSEEAGQSKEKS